MYEDEKKEHSLVIVEEKVVGEEQSFLVMEENDNDNDNDLNESWLECKVQYNINNDITTPYEESNLKITEKQLSHSSPSANQVKMVEYHDPDDNLKKEGFKKNITEDYSLTAAYIEIAISELFKLLSLNVPDIIPVYKISATDQTTTKKLIAIISEGIDSPTPLAKWEEIKRKVDVKEHKKIVIDFVLHQLISFLFCDEDRHPFNYLITEKGTLFSIDFDFAFAFFSDLNPKERDYFQQVLIKLVSGTDYDKNIFQIDPTVIESFPFLNRKNTPTYFPCKPPGNANTSKAYPDTFNDFIKKLISENKEEIQNEICHLILDLLTLDQETLQSRFNKKGIPAYMSKRILECINVRETELQKALANSQVFMNYLLTRYTKNIQNKNKTSSIFSARLDTFWEQLFEKMEKNIEGLQQNQLLSWITFVNNLKVNWIKHLSSSSSLGYREVDNLNTTLPSSLLAYAIQLQKELPVTPEQLKKIIQDDFFNCEKITLDQENSTKNIKAQNQIFLDFIFNVFSLFPHSKKIAHNPKQSTDKNSNFSEASIIPKSKKLEIPNDSSISLGFSTKQAEEITRIGILRKFLNKNTKMTDKALISSLYPALRDEKKLGEFLQLIFSEYTAQCKGILTKLKEELDAIKNTQENYITDDKIEEAFIAGFNHIIDFQGEKNIGTADDALQIQNTLHDTFPELYHTASRVDLFLSLDCKRLSYFLKNILTEKSPEKYNEYVNYFKKAFLEKKPPLVISSKIQSLITLISEKISMEKKSEITVLQDTYYIKGFLAALDARFDLPEEIFALLQKVQHSRANYIKFIQTQKEIIEQIERQKDNFLQLFSSRSLDKENSDFKRNLENFLFYGNKSFTLDVAKSVSAFLKKDSNKDIGDKHFCVNKNISLSLAMNEVIEIIKSKKCSSKERHYFLKKIMQLALLEDKSAISYLKIFYITASHQEIPSIQDLFSIDKNIIEISNTLLNMEEFTSQIKEKRFLNAEFILKKNYPIILEEFNNLINTISESDLIELISKSQEEYRKTNETGKRGWFFSFASTQENLTDNTLEKLKQKLSFPENFFALIDKHNKANTLENTLKNKTSVESIFLMNLFKKLLLIDREDSSVEIFTALVPLVNELISERRKKESEEKLKCFNIDSEFEFIKNEAAANTLTSYAESTDNFDPERLIQYLKNCNKSTMLELLETANAIYLNGSRGSTTLSSNASSSTFSNSSSSSDSVWSSISSWSASTLSVLSSSAEIKSPQSSAYERLKKALNNEDQRMIPSVFSFFNQKDLSWTNDDSSLKTIFFSLLYDASLNTHKITINTVDNTAIQATTYNKTIQKEAEKMYVCFQKQYQEEKNQKQSEKPSLL